MMFIAGFVSGVISMGLICGMMVILCRQSGYESRADERYINIDEGVVPCRHDERFGCPYAPDCRIKTDDCECDYYKSLLAESEGY